MSVSKGSQRITRKQAPPKFYYSHRNYLKFLLVDFESRCGYSCQHVDRAGGISCMDVDHHNPLLPLPQRNDYKNLILATRHCNGKKGERWPTLDQRNRGLRFLNPCEEPDYGVHIFEDPDTFELWGATPAGVYHIRYLDLNSPHLVRERLRRHELRKLKKGAHFITTRRRDRDPDALAGVRAFNDEVEKMIIPLPQKRRPAPPLR
jgi:hypothetical protein